MAMLNSRAMTTNDVFGRSIRGSFWPKMITVHYCKHLKAIKPDYKRRRTFAVER